MRVSTPQRHRVVRRSRGNEGAAEASSRFTKCLQGLPWRLNEWSPTGRSRGWRENPLVRPHPKLMGHQVDETTLPTSAPVWDRWMTFSCGMIRRRDRHRGILRRLPRLVWRKLALPLLLKRAVLLRLWRWKHRELTRQLVSLPTARLSTRMGQRNPQSRIARGPQWTVCRPHQKIVARGLMVQRPRRMASLSRVEGRLLLIRPARHRGLGLWPPQIPVLPLLQRNEIRPIALVIRMVPCFLS